VDLLGKASFHLAGSFLRLDASITELRLEIVPLVVSVDRYLIEDNFVLVPGLLVFDF
jgi:hypothetical protein